MILQLCYSLGKHSITTGVYMNHSFPIRDRGLQQKGSFESYGSAIPRLQELSYLEVTILGIVDGASFEEIRQRLVNHMITMRENSPATGNIATFRLAKDDTKRYVSNTSEALKELMKLGLVLRAALPASGRAARSYHNTTFALSPEGKRWAEMLRDDPKAAYNQLLSMLWRSHPQFVGYLKALENGGLVIPLAQWGELPEPRSRNGYIDFLTSQIVKGLSMGSAGWWAPEFDIRQAILDYLNARYESAEARGRSDPYPRNQDYINACEEAVVKFVFGRCGIPIDYISQEILRRWTKELGVANFSYHVPGFNALRLWPTATLEVTKDAVLAQRRGGEELLDQASALLAETYEQVRREDRSRSLWVPIYKVRAAVCWRLRIPDAVFDRALVETLAGKRGNALSFRANVDPAQYGNVPPSELPLRVETTHGIRNYYAMSLVPRREELCR